MSSGWARPREHVVVGQQFAPSGNNSICPEDTYHGRGLDGFRSYLRHGSVYAQRGPSFASDYRRADPSYYDVERPHGYGWERDDRRDANTTFYVVLNAMHNLGIPESDISRRTSFRYQHWGPWLVTDAHRN